jgi:hypothetical protein
VTASPGAVDRPAQRRRPPRYYILRVVRTGDPPLVSVIPGPFNDLIAAWQVAGHLREQQPEAIFIAGEMGSTEDPLARLR